MSRKVDKEATSGQGLDFQLIARNIRHHRKLRCYTQTDVAERAGVTLTTVYYLEKGKPIRLKTLKKIIEGIGSNFDEVCTRRGLLKTSSGDFVKDRKADRMWYERQDSREKKPTEDLVYIQDEHERMRLGQLGLVPQFVSLLNFTMEDGPGICLVELYQYYERGFNSTIYKDCIVYCLRGEALLKIGEQMVPLGEEEALGCSSASVVGMGPASSVPPGGRPPLIMWIGANRVGQVLKERKKARKSSSAAKA